MYCACLEGGGGSVKENFRIARALEMLFKCLGVVYVLRSKKKKTLFRIIF